MRNPLLTVLALAISLLIGACSTPRNATTSSPAAEGPCAQAAPVAGTPLRQIRVLARHNANQNTPTPLDFVFVYDPQLFAKLPRDAHSWFEQRDALRLQAGGGMQVVSLAIVPGSGPAHIDLPEETAEVHRVLAYPLYLAKPAQRALELTRFQRVKLTFEENTITMCRE